MTRVQPIRDKELLSKFKRFFQEKNERDFIMFLVGTQCGFRISDILPLRVKDVLGWDIIVYEKKTDKYREVRMPPELKKLFENMLTVNQKTNFYSSPVKERTNQLHESELMKYYVKLQSILILSEWVRIRCAKHMATITTRNLKTLRCCKKH